MKINCLPIILAAGLGTRLGTKKGNYSKCLLDINGKSLILYQLDNLNKLGFKEVVLVVGFKSQDFKNLIGDQYKEVKVIYAVNELFESSGSAFSILVSKDVWERNKKPMLLLHGDVFYDPSILLEALNFEKNNQIVLDENYPPLTGDELLVIGEKGLVSGLTKDPIKGEKIVGESLGINIWSTDFLNKYFTFLSLILKKEGKHLNWEPTIGPFLKEFPGLDLHYSGIKGRQWINVNYQEDLDIAVNELYPEIYSQKGLIEETIKAKNDRDITFK